MVAWASAAAVPQSSRRRGTGRAHAVFHVVAEDPQVQHVSADVQEAAVQEHRREDRHPGERGGTSPNDMMKSLTWSPSDSWNRKTSALTTMSVMVVYGVVREGMTSRSGIIDG